MYLSGFNDRQTATQSLFSIISSLFWLLIQFLSLSVLNWQLAQAVAFLPTTDC